MAGNTGSTMLENKLVGIKAQHANMKRTKSWPIKPSRSRSEKTSEKPLTKEDLVAHLKSGCKDKTNWRSDLTVQFSWMDTDFD